MRTELIHSVGLYLTLHNMQLSDYPLRHQKVPVKQRIVLKFLFFKSLGYKATHRELCSVLGERTCSLSQAKEWICQFEDGDLSCEDED
jgi:hypothetical protein